jgi:sugar transferase EpsL
MIRRIITLFCAVILMLVCMPILLVIALIILLSDGRPIFFRQLRAGQHGHPFYIYKFRTMKILSGLPDNALTSDTSRVTRIGKILRVTSLDELPSIINVLVGEMNFVGPRPLPIEYLPMYNAFQMRRHLVKPGITGWAQINGRNSLSWSQKFELDVWYVENFSLWLDLKILVLTVIIILSSKGVNASSGVTMGKFDGADNVDDRK